MLRPSLSDLHAAATVSSCAGVGVGLRYPHHQTFLHDRPPVGWIEIHAENYLEGIVLDDLLQIRQNYPVSVHVTGLSLGSVHGVSQDHLKQIAELCGRVEPGLVSDHISWSATASAHYPDLLPLPYTEEALAVCADNIDRVQEGLKRQILVENPSRYLAYAQADFSEAEFLAELVSRTGCGILLDLNNIFVSAVNLGRSPISELSNVRNYVPASAVGEIHVAGHTTELLPSGVQLRIDDHGSMVSEAVWQMLAAVIAWLGPRSVLVEWDTNIADFGALQMEANHCRGIVELVEARRHALA